MHDRFFDTTRGKIVEALRERRSASASDLAASFGLSANAIRQQLVILERDGLVVERSVRRGRTKPTYEYSLTSAAERFFPQQYDRMLNAVLREVRERDGDAAVASIFEAIGRRSARRVVAAVAPDAPPAERVAALASSLRERGVAAEVERKGDVIQLLEHTCPYAATVAEHPECCSAIHVVLDEVAPGARHVESLATGGDACRFEIPSP